MGGNLEIKPTESNKLLIENMVAILTNCEEI